MKFEGGEKNSWAIDGDTENAAKLTDVDSPTRARRFLREPLFHFLLIGLVLFTAYWLVTPTPASVRGSREIEITTDDIRQLDIGWMSQWQRHPTEEEMNGLIDQKVQQEILYREALELGLDQDDEIVKRRLAQKIDFLAEDISSIREPSDAELNEWFDKNGEKFTLPGRVTFDHLYFSPDKRGERAEVAARQALASIDQMQQTPSIQFGDQFMFQSHYSDRSLDQLGNIFGIRFGESLFKLPPGSWQGPVESGLGWHLVFIDSIAPARIPRFEEADQAAVRAEWLAVHRAAAKNKAFEIMKARYEIKLPSEPVPPVTGQQQRPKVHDEALANP